MLKRYLLTKVGSTERIPNSIAGALNLSCRQYRTHGKQVAQRTALLVRKLLMVLRRIQHLISFLQRQVPQVTEGLRHHAAALLRQRTQLAHRTAHLAALVGCKSLQGFAPLQHSLPLLRWQRIQMLQPVHHALLCFPRKLLKSRFVLQSTLLLVVVELMMLLYPLRQMFAAGCAWAHILRLRMPKPLHWVALSLRRSILLLRCTLRLPALLLLYSAYRLLATELRSADLLATELPSADLPATNLLL